jgi:hypothetical protein
MLHGMGSRLLVLVTIGLLASCGGGGGGSGGGTTTGTTSGTGSTGGASTPSAASGASAPAAASSPSGASTPAAASPGDSTASAPAAASTPAPASAPAAASTPAPASTPAASTPPSPTLAASTAIIDGTALGATYWTTGSTATGGQGQAVGGLNCAAPGNPYTYTHLSIYQNGRLLALPANIGTVAPTMTKQTGCVYPLHTDDTSGKIRMDASSNVSYTLGQFFAVWGQPLTAGNVAGVSGTPVTAYVNTGGVLTTYSGDLASLVLPPHGEVTIQIGTQMTQIPTYLWTDPPPINPNPITLVFGGTVGSTFWPNGNTASGGKGANVDGLICAANMSELYHVHAHVAIIKDGQWVALPANVGILSSCNYEMHTHDHTGIIHIETPNVKTFTLGQFFDIWGQPLTTTNVAGVTGNVVVYINDNGDSRRYMGDPRDIVLISHRLITLQVGTPPVTSLATYSWYEPQ